MELYNYIANKIYDPSLHQSFAELIARRALDGGDADQLHEICDFMGTRFRTLIQTAMEDKSGHKELAARIWCKDNNMYGVSLERLRAKLEEWEGADDWQNIRYYLEEEYYLTQCDDCGGWEISSHATGHYDNEDDRICRECIYNNYVYVDRYDIYVHSDRTRAAIDEYGNSITVHEDDDDFCWDDDLDEYVHHNYDQSVRLIGGYHTSKGSQRPQQSEWTKMKKRYLGVELEVEVKSDNYTPLDKVKLLHGKINNDEFGKRVFFERDGSLSNGFEIISQPMGLDRHRDLWAWLKSQEMVRGLRSHNTTTCGLHVHVSKENLTKLQIAKIVAFVNAPDNEQLIRAVARRYAEGYCKIKNKKIGQSASSEDRYEAVNITPRKTIEFRIFKGTLKYESVLAAIEFSNAMVEFCAEGRTSIQHLNADKFIEFINTEIAEDTKYLRPYLEQRLETA